MLRAPALVLILLVGVAGAAPEGRPDGKLRIALTGRIETLDPAKASSEPSGPSRICVANLFDQLYEYHHLKRPYELKPCLAAALPEVSEDRLVQTIRLKPGVRFVDDICFPGGKGREVKASDVIFCLLRLMDATVGSPARWLLERKIVGLDEFTAASKKAKPDPRRAEYGPAEGFPPVVGLAAVDDHTLRIHLLEPWPELPWVFAGLWLSVYAPEAVKFYGDRIGEHAVGTGPYKVTVFTNNRVLLLQRNPTYRDDRYPGEGNPRDEAEGHLESAGLALPLHEQVEVTAHEDPLAAWAAFHAGKADVAEVARDAFDSVVDPATGRWRDWVKERGITLHRDPRLEIFYDAFNMEDPVIGRPAGEKGRAIRRAICLAANDVWPMTRLYRYRSERVYGPLLPEFEGYDDEFRNDWLPRDDELVGERRAEVVEAAKDILSDAGLDPAKDIPVLKMTISDDRTSEMVFDELKKLVAEAGVRLEPEKVSWPEMQRRLRAKRAQMWTSSWYADYPDAQNFLQMFYGPNSPEPNYTNYKSEEFDSLYREARTLPSGQERTDLLREMQRIAMDDCPWRCRFRRIRWAASHQWLSGYRHNEITPKYFKYCRPDDDRRQKAVENWK